LHPTRLLSKLRTGHPFSTSASLRPDRAHQIARWIPRAHWIHSVLNFFYSQLLCPHRSIQNDLPCRQLKDGVDPDQIIAEVILGSNRVFFFLLFYEVAVVLCRVVTCAVIPWYFLALLVDKKNLSLLTFILTNTIIARLKTHDSDANTRVWPQFESNRAAPCGHHLCAHHRL
jgi:hypothetical protein